MPTTISQIIRKRRKPKTKKAKTPALSGCPQKSGVCENPRVIPPKKPNSANRKVVTVRLSNRKRVTAYIRGIGHSLQANARVLVSGLIRPDVGLKVGVIRGKNDTDSVKERKQGRSKFGAKKPNKK